MFVERFFRELHRYFTDAERRDAIVTGVADLLDQHQPRVGRRPLLGLGSRV
jgi:hypothetical protein